MTRALLFGLALALTAVSPQAFAAKRLGLFVGSNAAAFGGDDPLRHAEADAARLRQVFVELGGIEDADAVLLETPRAAQILGALASLSRRAAEDPESVLLFYYSGHADDRALLLGASELPLAELRSALDQVPAKLRVEVVDACRAGAITRAKGLKLGAPFQLRAEPTAEGRVVIASSAEWEDSQESDRLGGSFFTLHLSSGLRGAADGDADGRITLAEAYAYVYGRTLESTLGTASGPQHPTFRYDLRGRGDTVLTWIGDGSQAVLGLAGGGDYLVVEEATSRVAAEVRARSTGEQLALRPGRYRVARRTHDALLEGEVTLAAGEKRDAEPLLVRRTEYARLVRKGGARVASSSAWIEAGARGPLGAGIGVQPTLRLAYALALPWLTLRPRAGWADSALGGGLVTPRLTLDVRELTAGVEVRRAIDLPWVTLSGGLAADVLWLNQRDRASREPSRDAFGFVAGALVSVETQPWNGLVFALTGELDAYSYPSTGADRAPTGDGELLTVLTYRALGAIGYEF